MTLGHLKDAGAVSHLVALVTDAHEIVRRNALSALGQLGAAEGFDAVVTALHTEYDEELRGIAAYALGKIGDVRAIEVLETALGDTAETVRHSAVTALGRIGAPHALPALMRLYNTETSDAVRKEIGRAVTRLRAALV